MLINLVITVLLTSGPMFAGGKLSQKTQEDAAKFIMDLDRNMQVYEREYIDAVFQLRTDAKASDRISEVLNVKYRYVELKRPELGRIPWRDIQNKTILRLFEHYNNILSPGISVNLDESEHYRKLKIEMENAYIHATFCDTKNKCDLRETEVANILATSRDPKELESIYLEWYNRIGKRKRDLFKKYIYLTNKDAWKRGYTSAKWHWLENYGGRSFVETCERLFEKIMPLYKQLHAYTRYKLRNYYGKDMISERGAIPGHLLGNVWGLSWSNLKDILIPYPDQPYTNVTEAMIKQGYTPVTLYKMAEDFFVSLNMSRMVPAFWEKSIFERPSKSYQCAGQAWDMFRAGDFRITYCTMVTENHLIIVHHEMGHIQYYMAYEHLPFAFRDGANYAFHEGVGDAIGLTVVTNKHLKQIGLIDEYNTSKESRINFLMSQALFRIVSIPFTYLLDLYRWQAFEHAFADDEYNCKYWEMKYEIQGISSPQPRSERYLDVLAKYHVANDRSYIRYFGAAFLQFQFLKTLCEKAGQYEKGDPTKRLYECDFYGSTKAGNAFKKMLSEGSSRPWQDILEDFTGSRDMEAEPILEYFEELYEWLKEENERNGEYVGWEPRTDFCN